MATKLVSGRVKTVIFKSCIVLTHFRVPNEADLGRMSEEGKPTGWPTGPRARRLFSYIGVLARGWAAYVGYVAPLGVAMSALELPK